jgi:phage terminase large subunit
VADAQLQELWANLGEVVEAHVPRAPASFARYRDDPVGFATDVLRVSTLWSAQIEHLRAVATHRRVVAYGANGAGKTWDDAALALWWMFCRDGLVVATAAREGQLKEQFMRDVKILFHQSVDLPGELYSLAVRRPDNPYAGILCVAAGETSRIRGQHAPNMMVMLQEAQGLEEWVFQAAEMMAVGDTDRITATGNCDLGPQGPFFKAARSQHWKAVRFNALDHPNIIEGRTVIPGGPTQFSLDQRAGDYGVDSAFYQSSVLGEFPTDALEGLVKVSWLDAAFQRFESGALAEQMNAGRLVLGVDVARSGSDRSVVCCAQGPVIRDFHWWQGADLEVSAGRVIEVCRRYGVRQKVHANLAAENRLAASHFGGILVDNQPGDPIRYMEHGRKARLRIDTIGLGAGLHDRLAHQNYPVESFNSSSKPGGGPSVEARFANRRAQAFFALRKLLEDGAIALPPTHRDSLVRELTAICWTVNGTGKVIIEAKADIKVKLGGQSPDFADALAMAVTTDGSISFDTSHNGPIAF